ncbi:glycosyltransferase [Paracoccus liaowanqingii]|uniref:Glycosyltransferase n=1 Tax=Paracoccus liaowanqingii TaxID=2560053 RepID=A0A4Z1CRT8_9RHOB|nr:glycosyltransferase family 4 protein [Paracoccus liaowanqingii]TGN68024.1 glycosyltransferase [Paracoccus liaowanqingii]
MTQRTSNDSNRQAKSSNNGGKLTKLNQKDGKENIPKLRIAIFSHLHPAVSKGGAEIAAYQMYKELKADPNITAWFIAGDGGKVEPPLGSQIFQPFEEDEYVCASSGYSHFQHASRSTEMPENLELLLKQLRPDVVHFHHFANFGLEFFLYVRRTLPQAKIIVTLHEFLAICNHFGQMMKRPSLSLCHSASPRDCARCFPEHSSNDFFMRELFIRRFFLLADAFISPSQFLAERYIAWGIPADKMHIVENGSPFLPEQGAPPSDQKGIVFGFFGQISKLKGVNTLLEAATLLSKRRSIRNKLRIDIHGDASNQPPALREGLDALLQEAGSIVTMRGAYDNLNVHSLMQECHAILVPSIWWENSPLVIQEAFANKRPVICSDIGGMAEKVRNGIDGFHFRAGSAHELANLIEELTVNPERLYNAKLGIVSPPTIRETVIRVREIYTMPTRNSLQTS